MTVVEAEKASTSTGGGLPEASLPDSIQVLVLGMLPALVRGLFSPRRQAMRWLTKTDADGRTVRTLSGLRRKYGGEGIRLLGGRLVVVWGENAIRDVLDHSADVYASDSGAKGKGMSHFHPDALTISRGEAWRDRRAFNETVLATDERVHPYAERFLAVVAEEVASLPSGGALTWDDWERLFDAITLRIVFGDRARGERRITALLEKLMGEANRLVALNENDDYFEFYGLLERQLRDPEPGSLLARFTDAPQTDTTRVVHQIPHWIFATRDTLGANTLRALAAIAGERDVEARVRAEVDGADLSSPAAVDGFRYLEGCLEEAMRLWPTVPLLARETTRDTTLCGEQLDAGTQVMILNVFNHRDTGAVADADRLEPRRWQAGERDYRFNHLSNGTQDCPGGALVLLLGKAVLAGVVDRYELELREPRLPAGGALPHMLNFYETVFDVRRREAPAAADS